MRSVHTQAVVFPGGFGAAKTLSDFASKGAECSVDADVARVLRDFHANRKVIGLCCIAPVLAAKVIPGVSVTVGGESGELWPYAGTAAAIKAMGATHVPRSETGVFFDEKNKVVTAPAYMADTKSHVVFDNVAAMVSVLLDRC